MKRFFRTLKSGWISLGNAIGAVMSSVVLAVLYFFVIGPIALVSRIFRKDHLGLKSKRGKSYWSSHESKEPILENLKKQW